MQMENQHNRHRKIAALALRIGSFGVLLMLSACAAASGIGTDFNLGGIWDVPEDNGVLIWEDAAVVATEQHDGFILARNAVTELDLTEISSGEGNRQDDIQVAIRDMAENENVVALIGATTNEASMRSASLANFFNVPIIIPGADGELLLPENNFWAFRLSAPSSAYARYLFKDIIGDPTRENRFVTSRLRIGILYEQNTFGESAAVAAATEAMAQDVQIEIYANFDPGTPNPDDLNQIVQTALERTFDLVYLVSSQPETAAKLIHTFSTQAGEGSVMPLLIAQGAGFTSQEFLQSDLADQVIVFRQKFFAEDCPAPVNSISEAQAYAGVALLETAIKEARRTSLQAIDTSFLNSLRPTSSSRPIEKFRELLRDELKTTNREVPCLGLVTFDNSGQNKNLMFEFVISQEGEQTILASDDLLLVIKNMVDSN